MIIIVEGPDGAGKTTLCEELGDRLDCPVFKPEGSPLDGMSTLESQGNERGTIEVLTTLAEQTDIVLDRCFPSEMVYSTLFQREFSKSAVWALDEQVSKVPHLGIMVTFQDPDVGWAAAQERGVDNFGEREWRRSAHLFDRYIFDSAMDWIIVDGSDDQRLIIERVMSELVEGRDQYSDRNRIFMEMARQASRRATCLSRRQGAVLLSVTNHVIAVGYNGVPHNFPHPKQCERLRNGNKSGECLEGCNDSHAEENVLIHAALNGADPSGGTLFTLRSPCHRCARMIINAGIVELVYETVYDERALKMLESAHIDLIKLGGKNEARIAGLSQT